MKLISRLTILLLLLYSSGCDRNTELLYPDFDSILIGNNSAIIHLAYKQEIALDDSVRIRFDGVTADSRCPVNAICVWAGDGEINLNVSEKNSTLQYSLHTTLDPRQIVLSGYVIQLVNLMPARRTTDRIRPEDYNIDVRVTRVDGNFTRPVQLIDSVSTGMISNDSLNVTGVNLENDLLDITAGYGGGCKDHLIELFAQKEIGKSNPAQVTLRLSHFANGDMCKAYLTKKIKFDLTPLKLFLKSNYGLNGSVILNILDPEGRPFSSSGIVYIF